MSIEELRSDPLMWPDQYLWLDMAVRRGFKLPQWRVPVTTGGMRKWLKRYGVTVPEYLEFSNDKNLSMFRNNNPQWVLRAWCGLVLEHLEYKDNPKVDFQDIKRHEAKRIRIKKETNGN